MTIPTPLPDQGLLDETEWAVEAGSFRALGHEFSVRSHDPVAGEFLATVFDPLRAPGGTNVDPAWYSLADLGPNVGNRYRVYRDGSEVWEGDHAASQTGFVVSEVNRQAVACTPERLLLHASATERDGAAVIATGKFLSGKTTLAAGLCDAGFRYLTDEVTALDPESLEVAPYPKSLSLKPGAQRLFTTLHPVVDPRADAPRQAHLDPRRLQGGVAEAPAVPRVLLFPAYARDSETRFEPVSRGEALLLVREQTFNFQEFGRRGLDVLARLVQGCACYRFLVSDLDDAVRLVTATLDRVEGARAGG